MRLIWTVTAAVLLSSAAVAQRVASEPAVPIKKLIDEAFALRTKGDVPGAYAKAKQAVALAEKNRTRDPYSYFRALDAQNDLLPVGDLNASYAMLERLIPAADAARGANSFEGYFGRTMLAFTGYHLGKPGATREAIADSLFKLAPLARDDGERFGVVSLIIGLAQFYDGAGERDKAVETVARATRYFDVPPTTLDMNYGGARYTLSRLYGTWGDWDRALVMIDQAVKTYETLEGPTSDSLAPALIQRGTVLQRLDRQAEALAALRRAQVIADGATSTPLRTAALFALGRYHAANGQESLATPIFERVADLGKGGSAGVSGRTNALVELYGLAMRRGDYPAAVRYASAAAEDAETRTFKGGVLQAQVLLALARAHLANGDASAASKALDRANAILATASKPDDERRTEARLIAGRIAFETGDLPRARREIDAAIVALATRPGVTQPLLPEANFTLSRLLERQGDPAAARRAGRAAADTLTRQIVARAARTDAPPKLAVSETAVLDGALDGAWRSRVR